jgi:hypothetical protein
MASCLSTQRLRNLTTGILHTNMEDIREDLEAITGIPALSTYELPDILDALHPFLAEHIIEPRYWTDVLDVTHTGWMVLPAMPAAQRDALLLRLEAIPLP